MFPNNVVGVVHSEYLSIGTAGLALERRNEEILGKSSRTVKCKHARCPKITVPHLWLSRMGFSIGIEEQYEGR
jgi:hypothetical protein